MIRESIHKNGAMDLYTSVMKQSTVNSDDVALSYFGFDVTYGRLKNTRRSKRMLKQYCIENLPIYQHPAKIFLVDKVPIAKSGKVDNEQLTKIAESKSGYLIHHSGFIE